MNQGGVKVRHIGEESGPLWESFVAGHPESTTYHRWAWRSIFDDSFGYRSFYLIAEEASGGRPVGCLPMFLVGTPLNRRLVSVPFRDRGGPLWDAPDAFAALVAEARRIQAQTRARSLELKSVTRYPSRLAAEAELTERLYWVRSLLELRGLTRETYLERLDGKTRNMLRQAERASLEFDEIEDPAAAAPIWYHLHLRTQRSLGLPPFPERFFTRLIQLLFPDGGARLCVVRKGSRPIAATLLLLQRNTAIYGYSASDPDARDLRPNDHLLFNAICRLAERGFEDFDMGSDAPTQSGLLLFKKKWLAVQEPIPVYTLGAADLSARDSSDARYALARRVFRSFPAPLHRQTGCLTRFFG